MPSPKNLAKEFYSTSPHDTPSILHVSFASDPTAGLGAKLVPCDKTAHMFMPGYAVIAKVFDNGMASKAGVQPGDVLVAVNGQGFRRFAPDYDPDDVQIITPPDVKVDLDHRVVSADDVVADQDDPPTEGAKKIYDLLLDAIKLRKGESTAESPLILTLERYTWDARPLAWGRFLAARDDDIRNAMTMWQDHEQWKLNTFPISLVKPGLQRILRHKAVSELHVEHAEMPATVYVNYGTLMRMLYANEITADDIVLAFVLFTERMLSRSKDPRNAKTCQFIDLSNVTYSSGFRADVLKIIYSVFEPNYPETLFKMVMHPVSTVFVSAPRFHFRLFLLLNTHLCHDLKPPITTLPRRLQYVIATFLCFFIHSFVV